MILVLVGELPASRQVTSWAIPVIISFILLQWQSVRGPLAGAVKE